MGRMFRPAGRRRGHGNCRQNREKNGIGWYVEIEIADAVNQNGGDSGHGTKGGPSDQSAGIFQFAKTVSEKGDSYP